jgi:drug/metabolite transporter, DME family
MQDQPRESFSSGLVYVLLATLGWSLSGIFVRLMPELSGFQINCWRGYWLGVSLLVYLQLAYGTRLPDKFRSIPLSALISSSLCFAIGTTAYVTALTMVSTATVSVIGAMSPLVTGLLSPWITKERPSIFIWIAATLALAGAAIISYEGLETGNGFGIAVSLLVPITFAVQTLLLRRHRNHDLMPAICIGGFLAFMACGTVPLLACSLFGNLCLDVSGFSVDFKSLGLLMLMGPLQLAIPLVFYGLGARHVSAATLSVLSMLDAVLNPLWPLLFVNEIPGRYTVIGGAIILGAVLISIFGAHFYGNARRLSTR